VTDISDGVQPQPVTEPTDQDIAAPPTELEFAFPTLTKPKVAIVGFASGHAHKAPFGDDGIEKWGINQLWKVLPDRPFDRWFELHSLWEFYHANPGHQEFLRTFPGPVYVRAQDYRLALEWGIATAQPYPDQVILGQFRPYFNNTVSWLIALAIMMRPEWLGMYGVDMAQDTLLTAEYSEQRPSCEYFLGIAEGLGIETYLPGGSDLLKSTHLYGYEDSGPVLEKMMNRWNELSANQQKLQAEIGELESRASALRGTMTQMEGAKHEVSYWRKNWLTLPAGEE